MRGVKPSSLVTYGRAWAFYREYLEAHGVTVETAKREHVTACLLQTGWARSTMGTALAYLNAAYNFTVDELEILDRNPCRRVRLPKAPVRVPRTIPNRILRAIWNETRDQDDRLLFALFVWTGLRTIEVRRLTWNDVSLADGTLRVDGKGDRERIVPIHPRSVRCSLDGRSTTGTTTSSPDGRAEW